MWRRKITGFFSKITARLMRWRSRGASGERAAARFLRAKGFRLVARNWRSPVDRRDEIDLVCRDGDALVFVEVKTRAASALIDGYHAVDRRKKAVLRRAISAYLRALGPTQQPRTVRFDIVEVSVGDDGSREISHFENVTMPGREGRW